MFDNVEFDFSDYEERSGPFKVPPGDYACRYTKVEPTQVKQGQNEGTPGVICTFEILSGAYAGQTFQDRFYAMKSTKWRSAMFMEALGYKIKKLPNEKLPWEQLRGRSLCVSLKDGEPFGDNKTVKSEVGRYSKISTIQAEEPAAPEPEAAESAIDSFEVSDDITL